MDGVFVTSTSLRGVKRQSNPFLKLDRFVALAMTTERNSRDTALRTIKNAARRRRFRNSWKKKLGFLFRFCSFCRSLFRFSGLTLRGLLLCFFSCFLCSHFHCFLFCFLLSHSSFSNVEVLFEGNLTGMVGKESYSTSNNIHGFDLMT